jgi:beta-glucanase (GH16 family)
MKLPAVPGICASFFRIGNQYSGDPEIDLEFLTPDFAGTPGKGKVRCMLHPGNSGGARNLPFNPSEDFHVYGFLFTPERVQWTAERQVVQTIENVALGGDGIIMMNAWTGNPDWGGGPPAQDARTVYDWVKFWPGATTIPADGAAIRIARPKGGQDRFSGLIGFAPYVEGFTLTGRRAHAARPARQLLAAPAVD